jgi:hypothetical protein
MSLSDWKTLKCLKRKPLVYLPSDKGGEFCAIEKDRYLTAGMEHLTDTTTYEAVSHMKARSVEVKINRIWSKICDTRKIPAGIKRSFLSNNTNIPRFYHLIKTHKDSEEVKIRPIISNVNSPTTKISWLLSNILKPLLLNVPAHLESSSILVERLKALEPQKIREFPYPFSLDVVSLYTSIPITDAINNIMMIMESSQFSYKSLTPGDIQQLLQAVSTNTYLQFNDRLFLQKKGLAMGSSVSAILAILFMDTLERRIFLSNQWVSSYARYVDDIFILTKNKETAESIHESMNGLHPEIQFEIEHPSNNALSLLDFEVKTNEQSGTIDLQFYKKKAKKNVFLNFRSAIPMNTKENIVRNERKRILDRCTSTETSMVHSESFDKILLNNDYPEQWICRNKHPRSGKGRRNTTDSTFYIKLPFVNDEVSSRLRKTFLKRNINARFYHENSSLRSLLGSRSTTNECTLPDCPINDSKICFQQSIVYEITCCACQATYIGSTIRNLHTRTIEHLTNNASSVYKHVNVCARDIDLRHRVKTRTLAKDRDPINLRIKEAILIKDKRPTINSREELSELALLVL